MVIPQFQPVIGAALIALDIVGIKWTDKVIANLERTFSITKVTED